MRESDATGAARAFIYILLGLSLLCAIALAGASLVTSWFGPGEHAAEATIGPPEFRRPLLEAAEGEELARVHAAEAQALEHYAWIDREHGLAQVPIEMAMRALASRTSTRGGER